MNDEQTAELQTLIATLLGRCGPELTCDQCFEQLDRYVDLTLAQRDRDLLVPGMRAHLHGCPACCADYESLLACVAEMGASLA